MAHIYEQNIFIIVYSFEIFPFSLKVDLCLMCKHNYVELITRIYELWTSTHFFVCRRLFVHRRDTFQFRVDLKISGNSRTLLVSF